MTAKEARVKSDTVRSAQVQAAKKVALSEWEQSLIPAIEKVCKTGGYTANYIWGIDFFKDAQVAPCDFQDALISIFQLYGYKAEVHCDYFGNASVKQIRAHLSWKGEGNE